MLLYYKRIFRTKFFERAVWIVLVVVGLWGLAFFFATLFQSYPITQFWDLTDTTGVSDFTTMYLVEIASNLALDLFILCMPVPVIHRLQLERKKKWGLVALFWSGAA